MAKHQSRRPILSVENLEDRCLAAVDAFIWFEAPAPEQVQTETRAEAGAFEIKDFSFGVENPTTIGSATGGAGAGKIKFNEFQIKKTTDSAAPTLFDDTTAGAHYQKVTIEMRKSGGDPASADQPFVEFQFDTVFTTKIDWSAAGGDEGPEESITFVFGKLGVNYQPQ